MVWVLGSHGSGRQMMDIVDMTIQVGGKGGSVTYFENITSELR
jgi:hypothetical protein